MPKIKKQSLAAVASGRVQPEDLLSDRVFQGTVKQLAKKSELSKQKTIEYFKSKFRLSSVARTPHQTCLNEDDELEMKQGVDAGHTEMQGALPTEEEREALFSILHFLQNGEAEASFIVSTFLELKTDDINELLKRTNVNRDAFLELGNRFIGVLERNMPDFKSNPKKYRSLIAKLSNDANIMSRNAALDSYTKITVQLMRDASEIIRALCDNYSAFNDHK